MHAKDNIAQVKAKLGCFDEDDDQVGTDKVGIGKESIDEVSLVRFQAMDLQQLEHETGLLQQ